MFSMIQLLDLSMRQVLSNLPHDAGAILAYGLMALFLGFVWIGSRPKTNGSGRAKQKSDAV